MLCEECAALKPNNVNTECEWGMMILENLRETHKVPAQNTGTKIRKNTSKFVITRCEIEKYEHREFAQCRTAQCQSSQCPDP